MKTVIYNFCKICVLLLLFLVGCESQRTNVLRGIDGPYIFVEKDHLRLISVEKDSNSQHYIRDEKLGKEKQIFTTKVDNTDGDGFSFSLMDTHSVPSAIYSSQKKILVTSDNEGNFNSLYSLLVSNKVMDSNFNWTFDTGHLVIAGDMFDRGDNVIPCLWLLYKLEQEALKFGGQVHFILGNHEVMNLQGGIRYVRPKYLELAKVLFKESNEKKAYSYLLSNNNILVQWVKSKNTVEKIGNILFLHAGISSEVIDANLSILEINNIVRNNIRKNLYSTPGKDKFANLVMGRMGPLWYRGLVKDYKEYYKKMEADNINYILKFYDVDHIVIGHTIVDEEITSDYNGKVIRVDIKHPSEKFSGKSQALLIQDGNFLKVNDRGERFKLEFKQTTD